MKLIIDISEDDYRKVQDGRGSVSMMRKVIRNGTPLPKGHGRLIILSEDAVKRKQTHLNLSCQSWISEIGLSEATVAIIEADKEESEEKK